MSVTEMGVSARATAGIDWAWEDHAVAVVAGDGTVVQRFKAQHSAAGLRDLVRRLGRAQVQGVAIERPDGPVVDALLAAGLAVFVISPNQVKHLRSRYGSAGNKDDRFDAYVLGDTLRTDRRRLRELVPDSEATTTLRMTCRARKDLVTHRVALTNQLRAHLQIAFPGAVGLFRDLDSQISLCFLTRFPTQDKADWLSTKRLEAWLRGAHYSGRKSAQELHARLVAAPRGTIGSQGEARGQVTLALLGALKAITGQITVLEEQIVEQLALHPDASIFQSLPRAGTVRAARLLSEIGDARGRFPTAASLACLAGVAPSTRQSGKARVVTFRWGADKQLRDAVTDFAGDSRRASPWAAQLYEAAISRGHDHAHATRILARAWLGVIWKCWQTHTPYDPARHGALQALLHQSAVLAA